MKIILYFIVLMSVAGCSAPLGRFKMLAGPLLDIDDITIIKSKDEYFEKKVICLSEDNWNYLHGFYPTDPFFRKLFSEYPTADAFSHLKVTLVINVLPRKGCFEFSGTPVHFR